MNVELRLSARRATTRWRWRGAKGLLALASRFQAKELIFYAGENY